VSNKFVEISKGRTGIYVGGWPTKLGVQHQMHYIARYSQSIQLAAMASTRIVLLVVAISIFVVTFQLDFKIPDPYIKPLIFD